jgi:peroxiredoxin
VNRASRAGQFISAILLLLLAAILILQAGLPQRAAFTGQFTAGQVPIAPEIGALAPPFTKMTLDGRTIALDEMRGSPVIINFWATWCAPCLIEMPELQAVYEKYRAKGLHLLAVNLGESPDVTRKWVQSLALTFDVVLDESQTVANLYYLRGQPSTYVVSPEGVITEIFFGPIERSRLESAIAGFWN